MADLKDFDEILGDCLEALERGEGLADVLARYPQAADELKPLLETAAWFSNQKVTVEPRPGFVRASRSRLVEKIVAEPVAAEGWLQRILSGGWRVALQISLAVVMLACLVLGGSGVALASQQALPGEALYPVKIGLEEVELLVTLDVAKKIELHNQFSQARLMEIEELVMEGRFNYIREAVTNFEAHVNQASRLLSIIARRDPQKAIELAVALKETLAGQRSFLSFLMAAVPQEVLPEMLRALGIAASAEITIQAAQDEASSLTLLTATATSVREDEAYITATAAQRSLPSPTPTLLPSATRSATATSTISAPTVTATRTAIFTPTRTLPPTFTPTAIVEQVRPTPTFTPRPPTSTPVPPPEKTKKPPPNPTRRPPKPPKDG